MHLNILAPKDAVEQAFKKPNVFLAFIVVLLAGAIGLGVAAVLGVEVNAQATIVATEIRTIARFIAFIAIFAVLSMLARRELGNLQGLASALSLGFFVNLAGAIILALGTKLFVSQQAIQSIVNALFGQENIFALANTLRFSGTVNILGVFILALFSLGLATINVIILYYVSRQYLSVNKVLAILLALLVPLAIVLLPV